MKAKYLTMIDAEKIVNNLTHKVYYDWEEFGYHKSKILYIDSDNWIEHPKDSKICLLKSVVNWKGYEIMDARIEYIMDKHFLKFTIIDHDGEVKYKYFPIKKVAE